MLYIRSTLIISRSISSAPNVAKKKLYQVETMQYIQQRKRGWEIGRREWLDNSVGKQILIAQRRYMIVVWRISIAKVGLEKVEKSKARIITQNAGICIAMKIEIIFWFFLLKKDICTSSLAIKIDNSRMANMLIEERFVLVNTYCCITYNPLCRIKQCFSCYEYGHVLVNS